MDNFQDFIINSILASVVLICILTFGVGLGANYGKTQTDMLTDNYNLVPLQNQLNKTQHEAETWEKLFQSDNIFIVIGGIILKSFWGITVGIWTAITSFVTIYIGLVASIVGIPPIITGALLSILIFSLLFLGWRLIKIGW
jgi:uncharacterized membrane protein YccF (DUF307 family)